MAFPHFFDRQNTPSMVNILGVVGAFGGIVTSSLIWVAIEMAKDGGLSTAGAITLMVLGPILGGVIGVGAGQIIESNQDSAERAPLTPTPA